MRLVETPARRLRISLTPLIDVVFILLLFFMLSTQFSRQQVTELAIVADSSSPAQTDQTALRVHLSADGTIRINNKTLSPAMTLPDHPDVLAAIADSIPIQLDADDDVSLQQLLTTSDDLDQAGATILTLSALR